MPQKLIRNAARCKKCGIVIESKYTHDFVRCACGSIFVDGGLSYSRGGWPSGDINDWVEDLCEYEETEGEKSNDKPGTTG